jgi:hypothetical protein
MPRLKITRDTLHRRGAPGVDVPFHDAASDWLADGHWQRGRRWRRRGTLAAAGERPAEEQQCNRAPALSLPLIAAGENKLFVESEAAVLRA